MRREVVEIRIDNKGNFTFEAKEGFAGESCIERTRDLELALQGKGKAVSTEKTKAYYEGGDASPVTIKLT